MRRLVADHVRLLDHFQFLIHTAYLATRLFGQS
jgi:hypothetical protein